MRRRVLRYLAVIVAAGFVATVLIAWASALLVDLSGARGGVVGGWSTSQTAQWVNGDVRWSLNVVTTATATRINSDRRRGFDWAPSQATGKPDTPFMGDIVTAWASATTDGQKEWLELDYDPPVTPIAIYVYESYNPGAVTQATLFADDGTTRVISAGSATMRSGAAMANSSSSALRTTSTTPTRILKIPVSGPAMRTRRIRLDLDSP